jgi:hypothetical protein
MKQPSYLTLITFTSLSPHRKPLPAQRLLVLLLTLSINLPTMLLLAFFNDSLSLLKIYGTK